MLFRKVKTGTESIQEAISQFEDIAARIESGVLANTAEIAANKEAIAALESANVDLTAVANRGRSVATKLRDLMA